MKRSKNYCKYSKTLFILVLFLTTFVYSQDSFPWIDLPLKDISGYPLFSADKTINEKYPPAHAVDGSLNTCWVTHTDINTKSPAFYLRIPKEHGRILNIFSGYAKNRKLFKQNARPRTLKISLLAAINPEGYATENTRLYKTVEYHESFAITLKDTFCIQQIPLSFNWENICDFRKKTVNDFNEKFKAPIADSCLIIKIQVLNSYPGRKYNDICISEFFWENRFFSIQSEKFEEIDSIFIHDSENILMGVNNAKEHVKIYQDKSSVLQLMEVSANKKWAILISMPAEIEGRAETTYLLVDIPNKRILNSEVEKSTGIDISLYSIYFKTCSKGSLYLNYLSFEGDEKKIELK